MAGHISLLRLGLRENRMNELSRCWQGCLLPLGTVFAVVGSKSSWISLGESGSSGMLAWPLCTKRAGKQVCIALANDPPSDLCWEHCLDLDKLQVFFCKVVALCIVVAGAVSHLQCAFGKLAILCLCSAMPFSVLRIAPDTCWTGLPSWEVYHTSVPQQSSSSFRLLIKILPDLPCQSIIDLLLLRSGGHTKHIS